MINLELIKLSIDALLSYIEPLIRDTIAKDYAIRTSGRNGELDLLEQSLIYGKKKIANIMGSRGVGKTSLALMFAYKCSDFFKGGIYRLDPIVLTTLISGSELSLGQSLLASYRATLEVAKQKQDPSLFIFDDFASYFDENTARSFTSEIQEVLPSLPQARFIFITNVDIESSLIDIKIGLENLSKADTAAFIMKKLGKDLTIATIEELYKAFRGNPLATSVASDILSKGLFTPDELFSYLQPFKKPGIIGPDGQALDSKSELHKKIVIDVKAVNNDVLKALAAEPKLLYTLTPRRYEEVIAELFYRQGYEVELTPISRDGGKDIYVAKNDFAGKFLYVVECKRYAPDRPVNVGIIRQLYGVVESERVNAGILATTSFFTSGAKEYQQDVGFRLSLQDYFGVQEWFKMTKF